jgi:hypothetical protein
LRPIVSAFCLALEARKNPLWRGIIEAWQSLASAGRCGEE